MVLGMPKKTMELEVVGNELPLCGITEAALKECGEHKVGRVTQ